MKNHFNTFAATALVTVGLLGVIPEAKAQSLVSIRGENIQSQEKMVFSCTPLGNNQFLTSRQLVREIYDARYPLLIKERRPIGSAVPTIAWTVTLDSDHPLGDYTPESRCDAVSTRLTNLVASLGGPTIGLENLKRISGLGVVNYERVVFASYSPLFASRDNVIFTLKPGNRRKAQLVLTQFEIGTSRSIGGPDLLLLPIQE